MNIPTGITFDERETSLEVHRGVRLRSQPGLRGVALHLGMLALIVVAAVALLLAAGCAHTVKSSPKSSGALKGEAVKIDGLGTSIQAKGAAITEQAKGIQPNMTPEVATGVRSEITISAGDVVTLGGAVKTSSVVVTQGAAAAAKTELQNDKLIEDLATAKADAKFWGRVKLFALVAMVGCLAFGFATGTKIGYALAAAAFLLLVLTMTIQKYEQQLTWAGLVLIGAVMAYIGWKICTGRIAVGDLTASAGLAIEKLRKVDPDGASELVDGPNPLLSQVQNLTTQLLVRPHIKKVRARLVNKREPTK